MRTTDENILRLLEMLENPDAYTEQEIHDIINQDENTRETYRLMVEAKQSSRHRKNSEPINVEAAWQRFNQELQPKRQSMGWIKMVAAFFGVILVSGIAFAAIHLVRMVTEKDMKTPTQEVRLSNQHQQITGNDTVRKGTTDTIESKVTVEPVVFDNIPLEKMLPEIAAHYNAKVLFLNDESRELRFHFVWNPQQGIDQVVSDLNRFERLTVILNNDLITIE